MILVSLNFFHRTIYKLPFDTGIHYFLVAGYKLPGWYFNASFHVYWHVKKHYLRYYTMYSDNLLRSLQSKSIVHIYSFNVKLVPEPDHPDPCTPQVWISAGASRNPPLDRSLDRSKVILFLLILLDHSVVFSGSPLGRRRILWWWFFSHCDVSTCELEIDWTGQLDMCSFVCVYSVST